MLARTIKILRSTKWYIKSQNVAIQAQFKATIKFVTTTYSIKKGQPFYTIKNISFYIEDMHHKNARKQHGKDSNKNYKCTQDAYIKGHFGVICSAESIT
jgi:hypothetical protein